MFWCPAAGFNKYDKWMAGAIIHNYTLPLPRFRYFAVPLYAFGSRSFRMIGGAQFSFFPGKENSQITLGLNGSSFSNDLYVDSAENKNFLHFTKYAPFVRYEFTNRGTVSRSLEWKTFLISEKSLLFQREASGAYKITYPTGHRYINQITYSHKNNRILYPYEFSLSGEQDRKSTRLNSSHRT